jgi:hypothetical protein
MDRSSRRRILKVEELLSAAKKKREEKREKLHEAYLRQARLHATAVAAIVLSGEPKIDEPLKEAWRRALQHYGISDGNVETSINSQVGAAQELVPIILGNTKASAKFTEIFRAAPVWLLTFTYTFIDADLLSFDLPNKLWRYKWGRDGYEESLRWPLLPSDTIMAGDPVPDEEARLWPLPLKATQDFEDRRSQKQEDSPSPETGPIEDLKLLLDLAENPEKERELSRYEKLRLRHLLEDLSSSKN